VSRTSAPHPTNSLRSEVSVSFSHKGRRKVTEPVLIREAVDPHLAEAMCGLPAKLDATTDDDKAPFFFMRPNTGRFPPRYGYYLGLLLARRIGETMPLAQMAKLPPAEVRPLLEQALASYGPCPASG